jgi:hypothetical protein
VSVDPRHHHAVRYPLGTNIAAVRTFAMMFVCDGDPLFSGVAADLPDETAFFSASQKGTSQ